MTNTTRQFALLLALAAGGAWAHGPGGHGATRKDARPVAGAAAAVPSEAGKLPGRAGIRNTSLQPEAHGDQRFCMKNQQGKVHCIPFGPAH